MAFYFIKTHILLVDKEAGELASPRPYTISPNHVDRSMPIPTGVDLPPWLGDRVWGLGDATPPAGSRGTARS